MKKFRSYNWQHFSLSWQKFWKTRLPIKKKKTYYTRIWHHTNA